MPQVASSPPRIYLLTPPLSEAAAFAPRLSAALESGDVACVLLRLATADEGEAKKIVRALAPLVQKRDAALLVDTAAIAARAGADGAHIRATGDALVAALDDAIESLKPERIVGIGGVKTKHDAMSAGELDIDYVMFGDPAPDGYTPPQDATLEWVGWWAEIFNVPCVGYATTLEDVGPLVAERADFIALCTCVWDDPRGPAAAIADAAATIVATQVPE